MGSNPEDLLILTILIQMHGKVINFDLNSDEAYIFDNVRLLCKAGSLTDYKTTAANEFMLVSNLQKSFTSDLAESTYNMLKQEQSGLLVNNITYDKILSIMIGEPTIWDRLDPITYIQGIYLLSIHKGGRLIYPEQNKNVVNLLKLSDLYRLADIFNTTVPNLKDLSTIFPMQSIFINEENLVKEDNRLSEYEKEQRINQIRQQFYNNLKNWQLTLDGNKIVSIKLSSLIELIKRLIGKPCFINLLDYSCNSPTIYIPKEQQTLKQYALQEGDIEMGINIKKEYGGMKNRYKRKRRTNKYKLRQKIKTRKSKKSNKSKQIF